MKNENAMVKENIIYYGTTEASIVKFLENHLKCLKEEYQVEFFWDRTNKEQSALRFGVDYAGVPGDKREEIESVMESLMPALLSYGQHQYIEQQLSKKVIRMKDDPLTGVFNREYLMNRADIIKRAEIYPTTVIAAKLKGWKMIVDSYGTPSGDSLLQLMASILGKEADSDFLIGRMEDDIFVILIPLVREGEVESYCSRIESECEAYKDSVFAPEIEFGITATQMKFEDVNEKIQEAIAMVS